MAQIESMQRSSLSENPESRTIGHKKRNFRFAYKPWRMNKSTLYKLIIALLVFRQANRAFQPEARQLLQQIDSLKQASFVELNALNPDTLILNQLATQIGEKHGHLKLATHRFYLQVRSACTPEQATQLQEIFTPLYKDETPCAPQKNKHNQHNKSFKN